VISTTKRGEGRAVKGAEVLHIIDVKWYKFHLEYYNFWMLHEGQKGYEAYKKQMHRKPRHRKQNVRSSPFLISK
jgi:hypothetical protein